jgi:hypothetical protein
VAGWEVRGNPCRRWWRRLRNGGRRIYDGRARVTVIPGTIAPAAKPTKSVGKAERCELPGLSKTTESEAIESMEKAGSGLNESETIKSRDHDDSIVGGHDDSIVVGAHDNSHRRPPVHAPSGFRWGSRCNQRGTKDCKTSRYAHVTPLRTLGSRTPSKSVRPMVIAGVVRSIRCTLDGRCHDIGKANTNA